MSATVALGGDVMIQRPLGAPGRRRIGRLLGGAGAAFVNLEVVLSVRGQPADKMIRLRAEPGLAGELAAARVSVATVANNHAMDFGWDGLGDTLGALERAGVAAVGGGVDRDSALQPAIVEADGMRIAFLGLSCTLPNGCAAAPARPGIAGIRVVASVVLDPVTFDETPGMSPWVETNALPEQALDAVRAARADADAVVVGIHWGVPIGWMADFQGELATYQRPLGHALVDAGADVVAGHHSHVLNGIELYRGRPIFYGLGNLLFHDLFGAGLAVERTLPPYRTSSLSADAGRETVIAYVSLDGDGGVQAEVVPVWLDRSGEPTLCGPRRAALILARLRHSSAELGATLTDPGAGGRARVVAVGQPAASVRPAASISRFE